MKASADERCCGKNMAASFLPRLRGRWPEGPEGGIAAALSPSASAGTPASAPPPFTGEENHRGRVPMKFTLSWLKNPLDTQADVRAIADTLTNIRFEVEFVED